MDGQWNRWTAGAWGYSGCVVGPVHGRLVHGTSGWIVGPLDGCCMRPMDDGRTVEPGDNWGKGFDGRWDRFTAFALDHWTDGVWPIDGQWGRCTDGESGGRMVYGTNARTTFGLFGTGWTVFHILINLNLKWIVAASSC